VSTDNQREAGTIDTQRLSLQEYAKAQGFALCEVFCDEGISGGLEDRPGLSKLFDCLEADPSIDGVLIYKLDRLARDLYIQEHLIKKLDALGKKLISIKEPDLDSNDPMRKAFRQFLGVVAELEKSFITMRMSGGRIHKARNGGYAGGRAALGYVVKDGGLSIDETAAETVRVIFRMRGEGMTLRAIAKALNYRGIPTAKGGKWYAGTVRYILSNGLYWGHYAYKGESTARKDLAIIKA
jgi:site-specific DNA recombinase